MPHEPDRDRNQPRTQGQEHRTLSEYIDWSVEMASQMSGLELAVEGETDEEKAASFVEAMLEAGVAQRM